MRLNRTLTGIVAVLASVSLFAAGCSSSGSEADAAASHADTSESAPDAATETSTDAGTETEAETGSAEASGDTTESSAPAELTHLVVGELPIAECAPIFLGIKKGFFAEEGLEIEPSLGQGGAALVPAVMGGSAQFSYNSLTTLFVAQEQGLDIKLVSAGSRSGTADKLGAILVPTDSPIKTGADIAGKKVAINALQTLDYLLDILSLKAAGASDDDIASIQWVEIAFPDMLDALQSGQVDAITAVEPFSTKDLEEADVRILVPNRTINNTHPNLLLTGYFTSADYAAKNPDIVERFTRAMDKSLAYAQDHEDEVRAVIPEYTSLSADVANAVALQDWAPGVDRESLEYLSQAMVDNGLLKQPVDLDKLLYSTAN